MWIYQSSLCYLIGSLSDNSYTYYFQYSQSSAQKLYELFYKNNPALYLPRKYNKCLQLFGEIKSHEPVTSQEEEKII